MARQARDEAGYVWNLDASGNPVGPPVSGPGVSGSSAAPGGGRIISDPYAAKDEERKDTSANMERSRLGLSEAQFREQQGNNANSDARADRSDRISNPQKLRQEYGNLPEIKQYRVSTQMADAALHTAANPQGDLALTYAFSKAMDPGSVVRDQEQGSVSNTQPWFQSAVESVKKQFGMDGAGSFTPEARARLRQEVLRALASRKPLYDARRQEMADNATANGIEPYQVVGKSDTDVYAQSFRKYAEKNGDEGGVIASFIGGEPIRAEVTPTQQPKAAGYGATTSATPIPAPMQEEQNKYLAANWGKLDPRDYAAFRVNLDKKYGFGSNVVAYVADVPKLNSFAAQGGTPQQTGIQDIKKDLSGLDQFRNNMLSDKAGIGAGVASGLNAAGFGLPGLLAPAQTQALHEANPISTTVGDIAGGVLGTGIAAAGLKGAASRVGDKSIAALLANPLTADVAYGATYGATQAEDPLYGAAGGAAAALVGNRLGRAVGKVFPAVAGKGSAIRALDESVPSSEALRTQASGLYRQAEAKGLTATGDETLALADTTSGLLSREGRLSPTGRLTEVQPKVKEAHNLIGDYAGQPMTPTQVQTVRGVVADGLSSPEAGEKRIASLLLNNFDQWTDATNPELASGLADARRVASRYLQGDKIAETRELANVRAGQFSDSGAGNALRTDFRQLDRSIAKGQESFAPEVEQGVAEVARGTGIGNLLRNAGRFAPTGPVSAIPTLLAMGGGTAAAGPLGAATGAGVGVAALLARKLGQRVTERSAQVAENAAYGGPEYTAMLQSLIEDAATRAGRGGAVIAPEAARSIASYLN